MFQHLCQFVVRSQSAFGQLSPSIVLAAFALSLSHPGMTWAQNLIFHSGNQYIGAQGGLNEFGNLSGDYAAIGGNVINGFPSSGSYSPQAVAASASLDWLYSQAGEVSTFAQSITQSQEGVNLGLAEHRFVIEFTAVTDLYFTFTSNYNGLSTEGSPKYSVFLLDRSTLGNVFADNSQDPADLVPVENHSGMLIAGHSYALSGQSQVNAGDPASGIPANATGTFVFTTSPVDSIPMLTSQVIAGPDRDDNQVIDETIPVKSDTPSEFSFTVTYSSLGTTEATITDTIPKEWEVVSVVSDDPADGIEIYSSGFQFGSKFKRATTYEWSPTDSAGTATVTIRTRTLRRNKYEPKKAGTYELNSGAKALKPDGTPVLDNAGQPLVGPKFTVEAL
jgi:hypothetical protein